MAYNIIEGTAVQFYTSQVFKDVTGTPVDPDVVKFSYSIQGSAAVIFTYGVDADLVRIGTGNYKIKVSTTGKAGQWAWQWSGQPILGGADSSKTAVIFEGVLTVSPQNVG